MLRGFALASTLVLAVSLFSGTPAWAHPALRGAADPPAAVTSVTATPPATMAWSAAPASPVIPWPAMLVVAAALAIAWRRPRRALALAIVLILALFVFENGLHSVHHLGDLRSEAACSVAAATAHLAGTLVDGTTHAHLVLTSPEHVVPQRPLAFESSSLAAHQGRAPPISA
ncbi:MAG: hypothetical protein ACRELZ_19175 [Candidatus Rokuibacteriota bacterium]